MKETLEQLEQDAIQVRHRMKRAQYADDLIAMDQYAAELGEIKSKINKIKTKMSKEQTPMTAEMLETNQLIKLYFINGFERAYQEFEYDDLLKFVHNLINAEREQYAQAKVLEALEMEWIDVKQQPKESGEYLVSMVGGVDVAMYYKDTNEWKSVDRPLKNAYGKQVIRETLSPKAWMKLPKQK